MQHAAKIKVAAATTLLALAGLTGAGLAMRDGGQAGERTAAGPAPGTATTSVVAPQTRPTVVTVPAEVSVRDEEPGEAERDED